MSIDGNNNNEPVARPIIPSNGVIAADSCVLGADNTSLCHWISADTLGVSCLLTTGTREATAHRFRVSDQDREFGSIGYVYSLGVRVDHGQ